MKKNSTTIWKTAYLAVISILGIAACDDKAGIVDENYKGEALATLNGSLTVQDPKNGQKISVAVAWMSADMLFPSVDDESYRPDFEGDEIGEGTCDGSKAPYQSETYREDIGEFWAVESIEYDATSLLEFKLPIMNLPPESARVDLAEVDGNYGNSLGEGWFAQGFLIAFVDKNGDGRFDPSTLETEGDEVIAASIRESDNAEYEGLVIYLDGGFAIDDEILNNLEQGFNVVISGYDLESDEEWLTTDIDEPINLFTPDQIVQTELVDLQCSEVMHVVEFNKTLDEEDYSSNIDCSSEEMQSEDGEEILGIAWRDAQIDQDNPCILRELTGFVCFPAMTPPSAGVPFCNFEVDEGVEIAPENDTDDSAEGDTDASAGGK